MKIIILGASSYLAQKFLNKLYEQPDIEIICFYRDKISDVRKKTNITLSKNFKILKNTLLMIL